MNPRRRQATTLDEPGPAIEAHLEDLERLCRRYHARSLAVFGSAARKDFDPARSDIDLVVEFEPLSPGSHGDTYFGLLESLEKLFGRPVDLVVARSIINPFFRQSVESSSRLIYVAGSAEVPVRCAERRRPRSRVRGRQ